MNTNLQDNRIRSKESIQGLGRLSYDLRIRWVWIAIVLITIGLVFLCFLLYTYRVECLDTLPKEGSLATKRMPLTDKAFVVLGLALTVSTYISSVSRETIKSLKSNLYARKDELRISRMFNKVQRFDLLVISDLLVWVLIAFPVSVIIFYWCWCLPATKPFFETLQNWIVYGVLGLTAWMALMHFIQAWQHFEVRSIALRMYREWCSAPMHAYSIPFGPTLLQSEYFNEDVSKIKALLADEELVVYASLANRPVFMEVDPSHMSVKWKVVIQRSELPLATGLDMHRLEYLLRSLTHKGLISYEETDNENILSFNFNRFYGCCDMELKNSFDA